MQTTPSSSSCALPGESAQLGALHTAACRTGSEQEMLGGLCAAAGAVMPSGSWRWAGITGVLFRLDRPGRQGRGTSLSWAQQEWMSDALPRDGQSAGESFRDRFSVPVWSCCWLHLQKHLPASATQQAGVPATQLLHASFLGSLWDRNTYLETRARTANLKTYSKSSMTNT